MRNFFIILCLSMVGLSCQRGINEQAVKQAPVINYPKVFGQYANTPVLFCIPTSGDRPMKWQVEGLPEGVQLDENTGILTGSIAHDGEYKLKVKATNSAGEAHSELTIKVGNTLALTPVMGWNSWNTFADEINEDLVKQVVDSMVATGMRDMGYQYVNIDDFWQLEERDENGRIQVNKEKFPSGMKALADYIHERGMKMGIYSDAAELTCGGVAGSYGYEFQDAKDFADWGVDLVKYDYCHAPQVQDTAISRYSKMNKALRASGRSMILSVCEWGPLKPWEWAGKVGGSYYRTTWDIRNTWIDTVYDNKRNSIMQILDLNAGLAEYARPGLYNDADMLVVGIYDQQNAMVSHGKKVGCTDREYQAHMGLWCLMTSPLLCGNDVRDMNQATKDILMNPLALSINQDPLCKQAKRIFDDGDHEIFAKPLADGAWAVGFLNRNDEAAFEWDLSLTELELEGPVEITDVWEGNTFKNTSGVLKSNVLPHECKLFLVKKSDSI